MPGEPEIAPDSAAAPASAEPSFAGFWFKGPSETGRLVHLTMKKVCGDACAIDAECRAPKALSHAYGGGSGAMLKQEPPEA
jgi:hypothetical protein